MLRTIAVLTGLWLAVTALADEIRVIQLQNRSAAEIMPFVRPLLGPEDALNGLDYRLIIRTSDTRFREIERTIAQLDGVQRQLRLTVKHVLTRDAARTLAKLSGSVGIGDRTRVTVPGSNRPDDPGIAAEKRDGDDYLQARARQDVSHTTGVRTETLRVAEGQAAFIRTGQSVPYTTRTVRRHNGTTVVQEMPAYDATSGFQVRPRVSGQRVNLEISPRQASPGDLRSGVTNIRELATTVQVPLEAWTDLGAVLSESDARSRAILQGSQGGGGESWTVLLRVDDVTPGVRPETPAPPAPASRR